ncbi:hypothetical protein [Paenibacillus apiarius]|uniref:Uncharacterized protein n=2 Tax=Paenibacillus apiarius TaxID=46240 RepID=A0ABT4DYE8_9BACL|nr:hypothetical protein [Paenibacillus apiarius]MCY9512630.1 hypothetical protein [Paenibacillus apiarius]MCY9522387.1 hypothetical protein [Paenibacillus apiarius]MCY9553648.1 hypothetical protein [Paenibacillus apiarius]MCY9556592.1 hypothetical protein [Paenibacillus apiarius]MCY9682871.1 hypothetical protein [Paenibacillus apiarius]
MVLLSISTTLLFSMSTVFSNNNAYASEVTESFIQPDKIEYITSEQGRTIPVIYISDPVKAQKYMEQNGMRKTNDIQNFAFASDYTYVGYQGTFNYDYKVNYTENRSNKTFKWDRKITRSSTGKTSISVGADFNKFFKASVNKEWGETVTYEDTFKVEIPPNKQGEIWTWNVAENYLFKSGKAQFSAIRPTENFGNSILITDFRDPVNG